MKDNLENKFKELQGQFDTEEPAIGHFDRFEARLANEAKQTKEIKWNPATWRWLSVAASILLLIGFWLGSSSTEVGMELAEVSPKMEETQSFFVSTIQKEIESINLQRNDNNKQIIDDAFNQLTQLEKKYEELTLELEDSNEDQRIIYAMINNFQQRIIVLQTLLEQLEEIKNIQNELSEA